MTISLPLLKFSLNLINRLIQLLYCLEYSWPIVQAAYIEKVLFIAHFNEYPGSVALQGSYHLAAFKNAITVLELGLIPCLAENLWN
jgi:hypothetical protein